MRTLIYLVLLCFMHKASAQCNPIITPSGNTTFCDGNSVTLNASLGDTYQWYLNGNIIGGAQSNNYIASTAGSYTVEVDSVGCVDMSAPVTVAVNTVPAQPGPISGNTVFCGTTSQTYTIAPVMGASSYIWNQYGYNSMFLDTTTLPTMTGILLLPASVASPAGTLTVKAINECGVSDTSALSLSIYSPVEEGFSTPPWLFDLVSYGSLYCPEYENQDAFLYADWNGYAANSSASLYEWYRNGSLIPNSNVQKLMVDRGGTYYAKVFSGPCVTIVDKGFIHQCLPRATIYPQDSINTCLDTPTTLNVVFDVDGFSGSSYEWYWRLNGSMIPGSQNANSIIPVTSGKYEIRVHADPCAPNPNNIQCLNNPFPVQVTIPPVLEVTQTNDTLFATPGYDTYQWYESGNLLVGETQQKHTLQFDGFYTVEGVFMNGCVENSNPFDSDFMPPPPPPPPGINLNEPTEQMTVSPNPFTSNFVLQAKVAKNDSKATLSITDATGRILFEKEADVIDGVVEEKIDLGDAANTVGTIRLRSASTLKTTRFFKK